MFTHITHLIIANSILLLGLAISQITSNSAFVIGGLVGYGVSVAKMLVIAYLEDRKNHEQHSTFQQPRVWTN